MKCSDVENKTLAYLDESLSSHEFKEMTKHLDSCENCQKAIDETRALLTVFKEAPQAEPSRELRDDFLRNLDQEKRMQGSFLTRAEKKEFPWKTAFQIAASVLLLIAGYAMGSFRESVKTTSQIARLQEQTATLKQNMMLAMLENRSVSKRIQAVSYSEEIEQPDEAILGALIDRLHFDGSVNVRLAAAEALSKYGTQERVKKAFIKSLTNDNDPNIQIAVIQFLVDIQDKRALAPMQQLLEQPNTPDYVKEQVEVGLQQFI